MTRILIRAAILASLLAVGTSCTYHDPENYEARSVTNPSGIDFDSILNVSATPPIVPADGVSRTLITARIDPASTSRTISFETSLGTLFAAGRTAGSQAGRLSVQADDRGIATVELQAASQVATSKVTISVSAPIPASGPAPTPIIVRTFDVPFVPVDLDQLLTLESDAGALPADGFSSATLTATVRSAGGDLRQDVTFAASRGALVRFTDGPAEPAPVVRADASGVARILLRSDTTVGTARITATIPGGFERSLLVQFVAVNPDAIITLRADASAAPADGATRTRLVATVPAGLPAARRQVTFVTTDGDFASNAVAGNTKMAQVTADASNQAVVELKSPVLPGTASISASIASVATARATLEFTRALPSSIFVSSGNSAVARAGTASVRLTATLLRDIGQVSDNTVVTFEARDSSGATIGAFSEITLGKIDPGDPKTVKSTATFNPDDGAVAGTATITVRVGSVTGLVTIQLN
jgi:hypothetical protein